MVLNVNGVKICNGVKIRLYQTSANLANNHLLTDDWRSSQTINVDCDVGCMVARW